ncbi:MAG: chromate resistance protein ChrB domain-containing protein [Nitrososphaeraceae archaeon]
MKWITENMTKVDRIACPWLIKKFIDNNAEFLFVPAHKVIEHMKQEKERAIPFDIPNVENVALAGPGSKVKAVCL